MLLSVVKRHSINFLDDDDDDDDDAGLMYPVLLPYSHKLGELPCYQ